MENEKTRKLFGNNLRYYRKLKNLSIEKLALECDINPKYLSTVERGQNNISLDKIITLSKKLGIESYQLFVLSEENENESQITMLLSEIMKDDEGMIELYRGIITELKKYKSLISK